MPSRITAIRTDKQRVSGFLLDNPISPGQSGGPVLDTSGMVVGVAVATPPGSDRKAMIPVGHLSEFMAAPGLEFALPPVPFESRTKPMTWTVRLTPPAPGGKLPADVSVAVTVTSHDGKPRIFAAKPAGNGVFKATIVPYLDVDLSVREKATSKFKSGAYARDHNVRAGSKIFRLSDLDYFTGGADPRVKTRKGLEIKGKLTGLGTVTQMFNNRSVTIDLDDEVRVTVLTQPLTVGSMPTPTIEALVEARRGSKVVAKTRQRAELAFGPRDLSISGYGGTTESNRSARSMAGDPLSRLDAKLKVGGLLDFDDQPSGADKTIRPPKAAVGGARIVPRTEGATAAPLALRLEGTISDVTVGGGGRYLLLSLGDSRKLAIFDVNEAAVVKTISLPSANAIVAAGATKFLIAMPDERQIELWDLGKLQREGDRHSSPVDVQIRAIALGYDSNGPALVSWVDRPPRNPVGQTWLSLIDLESLRVLRIESPGASGPSPHKGIQGVSPSGGAFQPTGLPGELSRLHFRASAGGALFGIWNSDSSPSGFQSLSIHGKRLTGTQEYGPFGQIVPAPDGRTILAGSAGRLDASGKPIGRVEAQPSTDPELTIPTVDPMYYLSIGGLSISYPDKRKASPAPGEVTASIHATADGSRLLTVYGLDEMAGQERTDFGIKNDLTTEKRFHLVPAAHLLVTIPPAGDCLVLRKLDVKAALDQVGGDYLIVAPPPALIASPGRTLEHLITARSRKGKITCTLVDGPQGMAISPEGKIVWAVPLELSSSEVKAVVSVADDSGQERFVPLLISIK
jgi:hypothetical protein